MSGLRGRRSFDPRPPNSLGVPGVIGADRPTIGRDPAAAGWLPKAELLGGRHKVACGAQVACVGVDVEPAESQRHDMVDHGGRLSPALGEAVLAQPAGAL